MKKLSLTLDALQVESFDTTAVRAEKGTVFGEQCTCYTVCTCPGCYTCDATCPATCPYTCDDASCVGTCPSDCDFCPSEWDTCRPRLCGPEYQEP